MFFQIATMFPSLPQLLTMAVLTFPPPKGSGNGPASGWNQERKPFRQGRERDFPKREREYDKVVLLPLRDAAQIFAASEVLSLPFVP